LVPTSLFGVLSAEGPVEQKACSNFPPSFFLGRRVLRTTVLICAINHQLPHAGLEHFSSLVLFLSPEKLPRCGLRVVSHPFSHRVSDPHRFMQTTTFSEGRLPLFHSPGVKPNKRFEGRPKLFRSPPPGPPVTRFPPPKVFLFRTPIFISAPRRRPGRKILYFFLPRGVSRFFLDRLIFFSRRSLFYSSVPAPFSFTQAQVEHSGAQRKTGYCLFFDAFASITES